jgi:hypothetical protein
VTKPAEQKAKNSFLLIGQTLYVLDHLTKSASRLEVKEDVAMLMEQYWSPLGVVLHGRTFIKDAYEWKDEKKDRWYTYLTFKRRTRKNRNWWFHNEWEGRVVLMNTTDSRIPKDMPRQFLWRMGPHTITMDIQSWQINSATPPTETDFKKPEDRPGWNVIDPPPWALNSPRSKKD